MPWALQLPPSPESDQTRRRSRGYSEGARVVSRAVTPRAGTPRAAGAPAAAAAAEADAKEPLDDLLSLAASWAVQLRDLWNRNVECYQFPVPPEPKVPRGYLVFAEQNGGCFELRWSVDKPEARTLARVPSLPFACSEPSRNWPVGRACCFHPKPAGARFQADEQRRPVGALPRGVGHFQDTSPRRPSLLTRRGLRLLPRLAESAHAAPCVCVFPPLRARKTRPRSVLSTRPPTGAVQVGGPNVKKFYRGWLQYIKLAAQSGARLAFHSNVAKQPVAIYVMLRGDSTIVPLKVGGEAVPLGGVFAVAVVGARNDGLRGVRQLEPQVFLSIGDKIGASMPLGER